LAPLNPASDSAELSTVASQLDELVARVEAVGDTYRETPDSLIAAALDSAERSLNAARRAVRQAIAALNDLEVRS
jgi:methyl-accepting chemotaxis protein